MLNLREFLTNREFYYVSPEKTVAETARYMSERNIGAVCVIDGTRLVGILSERDMMTRIVAAGRDPEKTTAAEVMTAKPIIVQAKENCTECCRVMKKAGIRHLPIVDGDKLLGMVSLRDLLQADIDDKEEEIKLMNDYIYYTPPNAS